MEVSRLHVESAMGVVILSLFCLWRYRTSLLRTRDSHSIPATPEPEPKELTEDAAGEKSIYHANKARLASGALFPAPDPLPDFSLETARTRDYVYVNKTLRYPYYQTMAHQPLSPNNWIELSSSYRWYLAEKKRVIAEQGKKVIDSLPENDAACGELLECVVDFLTTRYPGLFDRLAETRDEKELDGIYSHVTEERYQWSKGCPPEGVEGLRIISRLTENDFLMARGREDGHIYFVGGLVAFPGFYLLSEKIGKSMYDVHQPVPQFNQKLLVSVERTLKRMDPNAPFERSSWEIVDDNNLFYHNIATLSEGEKCTTDPGDLYLRIDRQAFRKLPRSKAIIFAVHPLLKKLRDIREDSPLVPALLSKIHQETSKDLMEYKVAPAYQAELLPWLEEATKDQIARGLLKGDEEVQNFRDLPRPIEIRVPPVAVP
ncbi:actin-related protein 10 [Ceratobasidium sp. AG-Ba]|nr:actin-related protein 10 [Ceratobasidium sp. AG-Ba]QRW03937.1 actin-related protein 10 [Ceratobasidium sp. AG-Ba]